MASPNPRQDQEPAPDGDQQESVGKRWPSVLSIGKKAAIAGAAVASAPVVVPPLLLFSALGLAFALPFGVLFAGVFCTDKIMEALLFPDSGGPPQAQEEQEGEDEEKEEKGERGGGGEGSEPIGERETSSIYESAVEDQVSDGESEGVKIADDEGLYSEKNIWDQLSVIRTIVGYKPVMRSSYIEELRALYVFTGVEPPFSVKDSSDVVEINEKLQGLKSVVGIK